jgi:hypothetical protein
MRQSPEKGPKQQPGAKTCFVRNAERSLRTMQPSVRIAASRPSQLLLLLRFLILRRLRLRQHLLRPTRRSFLRSNLRNMGGRRQQRIRPLLTPDFGSGLSHTSLMQ